MTTDHFKIYKRWIKWIVNQNFTIVFKDFDHELEWSNFYIQKSNRIWFPIRTFKK